MADIAYEISIGVQRGPVLRLLVTGRPLSDYYAVRPAGRGRWRIDHVPTGNRVPIEPVTLAVARRVVGALLGVPGIDHAARSPDAYATPTGARAYVEHIATGGKGLTWAQWQTRQQRKAARRRRKAARKGRT